MIDRYEYQSKYRRFIQGIITEEDFKKYLNLSLSKDDLIKILVLSAKSLRDLVAIGEPLRENHWRLYRSFCMKIP